jgi:DNA segregation ATPase FtsK/SpoIIIE-like protein
MKLLRQLRDFFGKAFSAIRTHLSKKQLIVILSVMAAAIVAVIIFIVLRTRTPDTASAGEDHAAAITSDAAGGPACVEASDDEDMPVVETAAEGTKVESTEETTVLAKKEGTGQGYLNRCVFLGDSRTVAMVNYGFFNDDAALAQIGISHPSFEKNTFVNNAGREYTLRSYLESHQAPVIYIALGVNGINDPSEEHYESTFVTLIDDIADMAPNSNIVLMAIGPVDDNGTYRKTVQNAWIDKYNAFLLDTAKEKHIFYLDITEILKGANGQVKPEYNAGDGLHYSGSGCEAIFNYIVEHPVPGIPDDGEYVVKYIKPDPSKTKVTMDDGSGIDKDKLKDLMDMMMDGTPATSVNKSSSSAADAAATQQQKEKEEAQRKAAEEEEKRKEEERKKKEKEEADKKAKEEAERKAKEEADRKAKEEAARKAAEEEARKKAEEEASRQAEEEASRQAEEAASRAAEEEASRQAEEEASRQAEEEASRQAEEEASRQAEENQSPQDPSGESSP